MRSRPAVPTGGKIDHEAKVKPVEKGLAAPRSSKKTKTIFGGSSKREMHLELMGEDTPGPGAYMPTSTFGKAQAASSSQKLAASNKGTKLATNTSSFASGSPQRARPLAMHSPGPGAHTPNKAAIEKNTTNSAPHLRALGRRFSKLGSSDWDQDAKADPGPGEYETQGYKTLAKDMKNAVDTGSRQNPGFGVATAQHQLPHENAVTMDAELPGPGKYETNTSEISKADGHTSIFKAPTERKKNFDGPPQRGAGGKQPNQYDRGKKAAKGAMGAKPTKGKGGEKDTVHV